MTNPMTPTNKQTMEKSNELFELCKQVYEATGWGRMDNGLPTDEYYAANPVSIRLNKPDVIEGWQIWRWEDFGESGRLHYSLGRGHAVPLYTSDYLLEKLPVYSEDAEGMLSVTTRQGQERNGWMAYYEDIDGYSVGAEGIGKSPLKAILRLTLKLHEEKQL